MDDGSTKEEWKMVVETKKILDPKIKVHATCVRVPTFIGHGEAVNLELEQPLDEHEARALLSAAPGILVIDRREAGGYVTPKEVTGQDPVFVSRVRTDPDGRERALDVDRQRQPAQGRRAQRRADRRGADQGLHLRACALLLVSGGWERGFQADNSTARAGLATLPG